MGQAKRRGTFEQRKEQAIAKRQADAKAMADNIKPIPVRTQAVAIAHPPRRRSALAASMMIAAALLRR